MPEILTANTFALFKRLPVGATKTETEGRIKACAQAEFKDFLEGKVPMSSMSGFMAYRLLLLVRHVFLGQIPSEDQVAAIFHITIDRACSIIRTMQANYSGEMDTCLLKTIKTILTQPGDPEITEDGSFHVVKIRSSVIVNQMNLILSLHHPGADQIRRKTRKVGEYLISVDAREFFLEFVERIENVQ